MRPHRLRLTAFGPFPGTVELDLDEVSGAGPFLLRGATGAGKTSLLDAVGYALFGRVPGSRGMKQLRSDHAPDGVRTSVELWATVGGRAVHVLRSPDQQRPRSRGEGWTTDRAGVSVRVAQDLASLEADECEARYSGVQEANDELARLVGMTHEQFVQVVLLPQGDFARFLRARDEERATVLRALFDTSRFGAVEEHLKRRRDETRDGLAAARAAVAAAAAAVAAHAGADDPPPEGLAAWAGGLLDSATASHERAREVAAGTAAQLSALRRAHGTARTRVRLVTDLRGAASTWAELLAQASDVRRTAAELDAAERAAEVVGLHEAHLAAQARAEAALAGARAGLEAPDPGCGPGLPERVDATDPATAQRAVRELSDALAADAVAALRAHADLEALGRDARRLQQLLTDAATHRASLAQAQAEVARLRADAVILPARLAELDAELARGRDGAVGAEAAVRELGRWQDLAGLAAELVVLAQQVVAAERTDLAARRAHRDAEQHLDDLREARVAGMSGELAAGLRPGVPCRVCGATEHPAPAPGPDGAHDPQVEERARSEVSRLAASAGATAVALARAQGRREDVHARLAAAAAPDVEVPPLADGGPVHPGVEPELVAELDRRVDDARETLRSVRAAEALVARTTRLLEEARAEQSRAADALAAAELVVAGLGAAVDASEAEQERLRASLDQALAPEAGESATGAARATDGDPVATWAERTRAAAQRLAAVRRSADAVGLLLTALADVARTGEAAAGAARAAGWDDTAGAVAAARSRSWRETARDAVATHDRDLHEAAVRAARLRDELADDLADAPADEPAHGPAHGPGPGALTRLLAEPVLAEPAVAGQTVPDTAAVAALVRASEVALASCSERERQAAEAVAHAEQRHEEASHEVARCRATSDGLGHTVPRLLDAERSTAHLRDGAEAAKALADMCSGANAKGVPLSTYVLAAHLEHVVAAANQRLHGMSEGRYALVHVEEGEDRRRRAGLGLAVLDAWTGRQRPAGTLSGGETFLASLALALGLADVVTAEAGGVRVDALFVDEGFGTLDPDSLDRAMDVLDQLQEHGRMVGVVSHVGELAQRLPRQVLVRAGRGGSTVEVQAG